MTRPQGALDRLPSVSQGGPDLDRYLTTFSPLGVARVWFTRSDGLRDCLGDCAGEADLARLVLQHHTYRLGGQTEGEPDGLG